MYTEVLGSTQWLGRVKSYMLRRFGVYTVLVSHENFDSQGYVMSWNSKIMDRGWCDD